jgi:putative tricarboxylic transport membrane protein
LESINGLLSGFSVALSLTNVVYCFFGCLLGTLVGVLPGIGPAAAIALLFPTAMHIDPVGAIIMLAGIYYGAQYGGSTTSILLNIPGEATSVVTCMDGYQMARKGRAGPALGISAFGSFIAGTLATAGLVFLAPLLANVALKFGPPEFFSLTVMCMTMVTYLSKGSFIKALMMVPLGLMLATVGMDPHSGTFRFTYGTLTLRDGLGIVPIVMGLFGISEVLINVGTPVYRTFLKTKIKGLFPSLQDWKDSKWPILRGTLIGFGVGVLPGLGLASTFISYGIEKRISKHPEKFGTGIIEGVAAPESCNNAASQASFIPMLSLGIPTNVIMAMILGALMVYGITPGPLLLKQRPDLFWGLISSMYIGNCMLLVLNLPLIPVWVQILKIPYSYLFPSILIFCVIGSYTLSNNIGDVIVMFVFGVVGYLMKRFDFEAAPLVLALILGPLLEDNLRQALLISKGSFTIFVRRPISAAFLIVSIVILVSSVLRFRPKVRVEEVT